MFPREKHPAAGLEVLKGRQKIVLRDATGSRCLFKNRSDKTR
jgi:hypothetical protein